MTAVVLLPCPFCGGRAEIERVGSTRTSNIVACTDCGCRLESGDVFDPAASWNRRTQEAAWRPIEAAPRDGSYVLVTNGQYVDVACWSHGSFGGFVRDGDCLYWRPLPAPPPNAS